ncbi:hypothetical protein [Methanosarcina horonobensis]|uniref:hypothetical protein n=1 Tax=Methanosarcina horonobensis TaxID=418008 RepID=UPI000B1D8005|nr:hypothetical protein [Methanosarcina horonobensis]
MKYSITHEQFKKIIITEETVDQSSGEITPASEAEPVTISGHISDLTQQELSILDAALVEQGVRKFATSDSVTVGDIIRVTEYNNSLTDWVIEQLMYEASLIAKYSGEARKTYLLKRL